MSNSEFQFRELLAHLSARASKMLAARERMPLSLLLRVDGTVDVAVGVANTSDEFAKVLDAMQASLKVEVADEAIEAVCIAYPHDEDRTFVAWLENRENFCLCVRFPVIFKPKPHLDLSNIQVADGEVYVFPILDTE